MDSIPVEIRAQVLAACDAGEGTRVVAVRFDVSESWVRRVKQQRRETGQVAPKTAAPREPEWQAWADWLVAKVTLQPDIYLRELQAALHAELNEKVCLMTICKACTALELTRKKRRWSPANKIGPTLPPSANNGARSNQTSRPKSTSSSTKHGRKRA